MQGYASVMSINQPNNEVPKPNLKILQSNASSSDIPQTMIAFHSRNLIVKQEDVDKKQGKAGMISQMKSH
jgi:hypothetical protein